MSDSKKLHPEKKGISLLIHIFQNIILPRTEPIKTKQIHQQLIAEGYVISRSQLERTLNMFSSAFGVDRIDATKAHGSIYWLGTKASARISQTDMSLYISTDEHIGLEALFTPLPSDFKKLVVQPAERTLKRIETVKNVPQHFVHNVKQNTRLFCSYARKSGYKADILNEFQLSFNDLLDIEITSSELPPQAVDVFTPINLYEDNGELYVTGLSEFHGGTNFSYCLNKVTFVKSVDPKRSQVKRPHR